MKFIQNTWVRFSLFFIFGFLIGWFGRVIFFQPNKLVEIRENNAKYHFINPLLLVDSPIAAPEFNPLKNILN